VAIGAAFFETDDSRFGQIGSEAIMVLLRCRFTSLLIVGSCRRHVFDMTRSERLFPALRFTSRLVGGATIGRPGLMVYLQMPFSPPMP
jgi:hypothetical protein